MKIVVSTLILLSVVFASDVDASDIYKWTDEDGNVHYGDRPVGALSGSAETVALTSQRTNPEAVQARVEARQERQETRSEARTAAAEAEALEAEQRAAAEQKAEQCSQYRARLETYATSRRLYKLDDNGERVYLDNSQMQTARSDLQKRIQENCSG